jgi:hypothetical protein
LITFISALAYPLKLGSQAGSIAIAKGENGMGKPTVSAILAVGLLWLVLGGCAPASTPSQPTSTPSRVAPSPTLEPTKTETATATLIPSPTPLPGSVVVSLDMLGVGIPWLPMDDTAKPSVSYIGFNTQAPPFNNNLVRLAFAHAIDRQAITDMARTYWENNPSPATTLTPPQTMGRNLYG